MAMSHAKRRFECSTHSFSMTSLILSPPRHAAANYYLCLAGEIETILISTKQPSNTKGQRCTLSKLHTVTLFRPIWSPQCSHQLHFNCQIKPRQRITTNCPQAQTKFWLFELFTSLAKAQFKLVCLHQHVVISHLFVLQLSRLHYMAGFLKNLIKFKSRGNGHHTR